MLLVFIQIVEVIGCAIWMHEGSSPSGLIFWMATLGIIQICCIYNEFKEEKITKIVDDDKKDNKKGEKKN